MTDILPWLITNWQALAYGLGFLILLILGISFAVPWYFRRLFIESEREPPKSSGGHSADPMTDIHGDVPHVPEKAKGRAA